MDLCQFAGFLEIAHWVQDFKCAQSYRLVTVALHKCRTERKVGFEVQIAVGNPTISWEITGMRSVRMVSVPVQS